ncbi:MAG: DNA-directed RNA polymerase II core subunit [Cirrosporium novae-zelandiae]|nr:MAG: DNA-directed RNA polymerase II core subunit [Cirrosporium novae-zelandiae]
MGLSHTYEFLNRSFCFHWFIKIPPNVPGPGGFELHKLTDDGKLSFAEFLLEPGEKKIEQTPDTRVANCMWFKVKKEDHTLGNMLSERIGKNPHVLFNGYKIDHPLKAEFDLRVQTDGQISPKDAVLQAAKDLVNDLGIMSRQFTKEWELRKMVGAVDNQNAQDDQQRQI